MRDQIHGVKRNWLTRLLWRIAWSTQSILMGLESTKSPLWKLDFRWDRRRPLTGMNFFWLSIGCKLFLNLTNQAFIFVANCKQITSSIFLENYFPRYLRYFRNTTCSPNPISVIPNISSLSVHPILIWRLDLKYWAVLKARGIEENFRRSNDEGLKKERWKEI